MMKTPRLLFTTIALLMSATTAMANNVLYAEFSDEDNNGTEETMTLKYGESSAYYFTDTGWSSDFKNNDALKKKISVVNVDASCSGYTGTSLNSLFYYLTKATTINNLGNLNTANVTDMSTMFYYCEALTSLDISGFDTRKVTDMSWMFARCRAMTTLTLGENFNTANVTTMYNMFAMCHVLETIDLSKFNTAKVTNMKCMFDNCRAITTLDLSTFNTTNVEDMSSMFSNCLKLTSITFGENFTTAKVTDMSGMFLGCYELPSLDLSGFNTAKVTTMLSMFRSCYLLSTLVLGENFITTNVTDMSMMFRNCSKLTSLDLTTFNVSNVTLMKDMFRDCELLSSVNLSTFVPSNVTDMSNMFNGCYALKTITFGDNFNASNVTTMSYMFANCRALESIIFPENFDASEVTTMSYMFYYCTKLETVDLSNVKTEKLESMASMFSCCSALDNVVLGGKFNTSTVTNMNSLFNSCGPLTSLDLSKLNTENVTDMSYMFSYVLATSLDLSSLNTQNVTKMNYLFGNSQKLETIYFGEQFNTAAVTNMDMMFYVCKALKSLDLSSFNTQKVTDVRYMFYQCSNLKSIIIGDNWNTNGMTSSISMFYQCNNLVGEDGTAFDANTVDVTNAHTGEGGYLTKKTETLTTTADGEGNYWRTYYNANVGCVADDNTTVYTAKVNQDKTEVILTAVADNVIPADNAVVLKSDNATISMTRVAQTDKLENNELRGSQSDVAAGDFADEGTIYTLANGSEGLNFYKFTGNTLKANRAFLVVSGTGARVIKLGNDEATGVEEISNREPANDACFDLQGRRIAQPAKGLYIINGKKVIK